MFRCLKILGETVKQEILQQMFLHLEILDLKSSSEQVFSERWRSGAPEIWLANQNQILYERPYFETFQGFDQDQLKCSPKQHYNNQYEAKSITWKL